MTDIDKRIDEIEEYAVYCKKWDKTNPIIKAQFIIRELQAELAARNEALQRIASKPLTQNNGEANNCISIAKNALGLPLIGDGLPR